jgi:hypothetical protein
MALDPPIVIIDGGLMDPETTARIIRLSGRGLRATVRTVLLCSNRLRLEVFRRLISMSLFCFAIGSRCAKLAGLLVVSPTDSISTGGLVLLRMSWRT